jgi:hypothetical protein
MGTVAVVERTHNFKLRLATFRTGGLVDNEMAGVALVPALGYRDIFKALVLFSNFPLFLVPFHTTR